MGYGPAERVCLDHELSMKHAENCPPPFYLCTDCAEDLHNKKPTYQFHIVLQPLLLATWKCEYKVIVLFLFYQTTSVKDIFIKLLKGM